MRQYRSLSTVNRDRLMSRVVSRLVCVAARLAAPRRAYFDPHCSLLNSCKPREASSAVLDHGSPLLRREQWHTADATI